MLQFGVLITILAVAPDPFSQQLLQLSSERESRVFCESRLAYGARVEVYDAGIIECIAGDAGSCYAVTPLGMQTAISSALSRGIEDAKRMTTLACPVGNCTWPASETMGVCHKCHDITSELKKTNRFGQYGHYTKDVENPRNKSLTFGALGWTAIALPNGHAIIFRNTTKDREGITDSLPEYRMTSFSTGQRENTVRFTDVEALIWSTSVIARHDNANAPPSSREDEVSPTEQLRAAECGIYYCVKTIQAEYESNIVREATSQATRFSLTPIAWKPYTTDTSGIPSGFLNNGSIPGDLQFDEYTAALERAPLSFQNPSNSSEPIYSVSQNAVLSISKHLQDLWNSTEAMFPQTQRVPFDGTYTNKSLIINSRVDRGLRNITVGLMAPRVLRWRVQGLVI